MEELHLKSQKHHNIRNVLLSHNGDSEAIKENKWSKGMLLIPWANRINEVRNINYVNLIIHYKNRSFPGQV